MKLKADDELSDAQFLKLRELRAVNGNPCSCHINPPCSTCVDSITQEEADELNGEDDEGS